jgi:hypothetical protein
MRALHIGLLLVLTCGYSKGLWSRASPNAGQTPLRVAAVGSVLLELRSTTVDCVPLGLAVARST